MVLLLTVMGEVRAAGTYTINITHGKILSSDDAFALSVLYLYEDVIKIFEDGEGHKDVAQNVIPYGNITLFRYDINTGGVVPHIGPRFPDWGIGYIYHGGTTGVLAA